MFKTIIFILLPLTAHAQAQACPFSGATLGTLTEDSRFQHLGQSEAPYPEHLFKSYQHMLGKFSTEDCRDSIVADRFKHLLTGGIFTAFYTNEDSCDGGNSYGVIITETTPTPERAVAIIQDSDISCLK